jgi:Zn finger protein HypA/HybF involved in hydrogenase expression
MPVLIYQDNQGQYKEQEIAGKMEVTSIGSDPSKNQVVFPSSLGVTPRHAVILRSAVNQLLVLVNLAGQDTRVNGRQVVSIKVLRQKDEIQLGQAKLIIWEIRIIALKPHSPYINQSCLFCSRGVQANDEVIICPRCSSPFHRLCWFSLDICGKYGCNYPVKERNLEALSSRVKFEEVGIDLLKKGATCHARTRGDQIPFRPKDQITYCPSCRTTYHILCWLNLERCTQPNCGFDNRQLITEILSVGEGGKPHMGSDYGK